MIETYVVQVNSNGKWKSAYRGDDENQVQSVYDASTIEYGSNAVRILKSNGIKVDGSIQWIIAQVPVEPEPEPELPISEMVVPTSKNTKNNPSKKSATKHSKTKYTIFNIHKVKNPEEAGGFSKLVFWLLIIIGGLLLPIIGLAVGLWKRKDPILVKQMQAKAILATASLFIGINLISAFMDISDTTVGDKTNTDIVTQVSNIEQSNTKPKKRTPIGNKRAYTLSTTDIEIAKIARQYALSQIGSCKGYDTWGIEAQLPHIPYQQSDLRIENIIYIGKIVDKSFLNNIRNNDEKYFFNNYVHKIVKEPIDEAERLKFRRIGFIVPPITFNIRFQSKLRAGRRMGGSYNNVFDWESGLKTHIAQIRVYKLKGKDWEVESTLGKFACEAAIGFVE